MMILLIIIAIEPTTCHTVCSITSYNNTLFRLVTVTNNGRCRPLRHEQSALPEWTPQAISLEALDSDDSASEYGESSDNCDSDEE